MQCVEDDGIGFAGGAYLVQTQELSPDKIRTSCTVSLIVTLVMASTLAFLARPIAAYYATPELERYLQVIGISYLMGPFSLPIMALMTREMAFERLALIGVVTTVVSGTISITLAIFGFSAMSYAWASVASAASGVLLCFFFYPDLSIFRPLLREWRRVLGFGVFDSATTVLNRLTENLFYLILGRLLNVQAVGLWQRAFSLSGFPEKVILAGFGAVALPAFRDRIRFFKDCGFVEFFAQSEFEQFFAGFANLLFQLGFQLGHVVFGEGEILAGTLHGRSNFRGGAGGIFKISAYRFLHFFAGTEQPEHDEQGHHGGNEIGVGDLPGAAVMASVAAFFLEDDDGTSFVHCVSLRLLFASRRG